MSFGLKRSRRKAHSKWSRSAGPVGLSLSNGTPRRGCFCPYPSGRDCFGSWPALATRTKAFGPGHLVPALPNNPNQPLRHASALFRQSLSLRNSESCRTIESRGELWRGSAPSSSESVQYALCRVWLRTLVALARQGRRALPAVRVSCHMFQVRRLECDGLFSGRGKRLSRKR